jgi:hypothetical protein
MMKLLEPKLIGLMNDDEKHFIMGRQILFIAFGKLRIKNSIKLQVIVIVHVGHKEVCANVRRERPMANGEFYLN